MRGQSWFYLKPYWLRGGIVGAIVASALSLISLPCLIIIEGAASTVCIFPLWPGVVLFWSLQDNFYISLGAIGEFAAMNVFNFFIWFFLGIFVGWLVGKLKS